MDPPEFNLDGLGDILASLSAEDLENLSSIAQQFTQSTSDSHEANEEKNGQGGFSLDPEMLLKMMHIIEKLNSRQNDPRCNLITALKPLLSPARRQKADKALELLKIFSLFSLGDIFNME